MALVADGTDIEVLDSGLKLHHASNGVITSIALEKPKDNNGDDFFIRLKSNPSYYVSNARLEWYLTKIKKFLDSPTLTGAIKTPSILESRVENETLILKVSKYQSEVVLEYACTRVQISMDKTFEGIYYENYNFFFHNFDNPTMVEVDLSGLTKGVNYYVRVCHGASGIESVWSSPVRFTFNKASLTKPTILSCVTTTESKYPYNTSINVTSSDFEEVDGAHKSTTWRIYSKIDGELKMLWSQEDDVKNLTSIKIDNLYPDVLQHDLPYYITTSYKNTGNEFSPESEPFLFTDNTVVLMPPQNLESYPSAINVTNPIFSIHSDLYFNKDGEEFIIPPSEIRAIYWTITNLNGESDPLKYTTSTTFLTLPLGTLEERNRYRVEVYYIHRSLGVSGTISKVFNTNKFPKILDGLLVPKKIYRSMGYYGEIKTSEFMPSDITYLGDFIPGYKYKVRDEVSSNGNLYICIKNTPEESYKFEDYFSLSLTNENRETYKSGIPSPMRILDLLGTGLEENRVSTEHAWLKVQSNKGKILYISKQHNLTNISINDMISRGLYHPKRKTIRLYGNLYYVRMLIDNTYYGYDSIDPLYPDKEFYTNETNTVKLEYGEQDLLQSLIDTKLADYDPSSLGFEGEDRKEIFYSADKEILAYRFLKDRHDGVPIVNTDSKSYNYRLVLEYIPEEEYPIFHISSKLPGPSDISSYQQFMDACYLGYCTVDEFINSEVIDFATGLGSLKSVPNLGWHKVYYQGLVYYISDGSNLKNIQVNDILTYNLLTKEKRYQVGDPESVKLGKLVFNNLCFNIGCPEVVDKYMQENTINTTTEPVESINIFGKTNGKVNFAINCFFSDVILNMFRKTIRPNPSENGYKGHYKYLEKFITVGESENNGELGISQIGSSLEPEATILSGNYAYNKGGGTPKHILNYQTNPYNIKELTSPTTPVEIVFILSICPTIDFNSAWK